MSQRVVFEAATPADADDIAQVYLTSRKHFLPYARLVHSDEQVRQWIAEALIPTSDIWVARLDGRIVGMLAIRRDETAGWIDQLYLLPEAVGQGMGSEFIQIAKTNLGPPIRLYTFQANPGARRFYERHGFKAIAFSDGVQNEEKCPDILYEWGDKKNPFS